MNKFSKSILFAALAIVGVACSSAEVETDTVVTDSVAVETVAVDTVVTTTAD